MRRERPLAELESFSHHVNAQLQQHGVAPLRVEELLGARLYTGPLFVKYNAALRGTAKASPAFAADAFETLCKGNRYPTTIHLINSAIIKLSSLTKATKVYRGMGGRALPACFKLKDEFDVQGGVDLAFLSCTTDQEVAFSYGSKGGVIFEVQQGMVDRGANLSWLSQYPFENEILFPPLTCLEVVRMRVHDEALVVSIRPVVNQAAQTIEAALSKMQRSHVQLIDIMMDDFKRVGLPADALAPLALTRRIAEQRVPTWFNSASSYKAATEAAFVAKLEVFAAAREAHVWATDEVKHLGSDAAAVHARDIAERMYVAAELCALEGEVATAADLLCLSVATAVDHPRLRPTAASEVEAALQLTAGKSCNDAAVLQAARVSLLAAHLLLSVNVASPWADTLVLLVSGRGEFTLRAFTRGLLPHWRYSGIGMSVSGIDPIADDSGSIEPVSDSLQSLVRLDCSSEDVLWLLANRLQADVAKLNGAFVTPFRPNGVDAMLRAAAAIGHVALIDLLLPLVSNVDSADARANTALHLAAHNGQSAACARLVSAGADRDVTNADGATPYELAVKADSPFAWREISPSFLDKELIAAVRGAEVPVLLVEAMKGERQLLTSIEMQEAICQVEQHDVAEILNAPQQTGPNVSVLVFAASRGYATSTEKLLELRADPLLCTTSGASALDAAVESGSEQTVCALLRSSSPAPSGSSGLKLLGSSGYTALHRASERGFESIVLILLEAVTTVDAQDDKGQTPLMLAAGRGHAGIVQTLLRARASASAVDVAGRSPVHVAALAGHAYVLSLLLGARAGDTDEVVRLTEQADKRGLSPLALAAARGHVSTARVLLQSNARADATDSRGFTPMHHASNRGHSTMVTTLGATTLGAASIETVDQLGRTPLHCCCAMGQIAVAEALLTLGTARTSALLLARDLEGRTPLMLAVRNGHLPVVRRLLELSSSQSAPLIKTQLGITDTGGYSALEHARELNETLRAAGATHSAKDSDQLVQALERVAQDVHNSLLSPSQGLPPLALLPPLSLPMAGQHPTEQLTAKDAAAVVLENCRLREELAALRREHTAVMIARTTAEERAEAAEAAAAAALQADARETLSPEALESTVLTEQERLKGQEHVGQLKVHEQALRLLEATKLRKAAVKLCGPRHPTTLVSMSNEAQLLKALGQLKTACDALHELRALCMEVHGNNHSATLAATIALAGTMQNMGRLGEARPLCEAAVNVSEFLHGKDAVSTIVARGNLGQLNQDLGDLVEAKRHFTAAHDAAMTTFGPRHPVTLRTTGNLADLQRELGLIEVGIATMGDVASLAEDVLGADDPLTLSTRAKAARLLLAIPPAGASAAAAVAAAARAQEGLRQLDAVVKRMEETLGNSNPQTKKYQMVLRQAIESTGSVADEAARWEAAMALHEKHAGKGHQCIAMLKLDAQLSSLEWVVGSPSRNLGRGIREEHCERADSALSFVCLLGKTRPDWEYYAATDPTEGLRLLGISDYPQYPGANAKRQLLPVQELDELRGRLNAALDARDLPRLHRAEMEGARLFTGPMVRPPFERVFDPPQHPSCDCAVTQSAVTRLTAVHQV